MNLPALAITLLLVSTTCFAQGRKPAVEDFVGIEVDETAATPRGTEPLFNLEHDMNKMNEADKKAAQPSNAVLENESTTWSFNVIMAVIAILGMPMVSMFMVLHHLRRKARVESHSNIEVLEKYRKEKELAMKSKELEKKAS